MAKVAEEDQKWAVENRNDLTGESVRLIECKAEWTAKLLSDNANDYFKKNERPFSSSYFRIK